MKKIHQIYISDNNLPPSDYVQGKINKLKSLYPDYSYKLYNHEECKGIVKDIFGTKALNLFNSIKPYAFKADLARYTILYNEGGYYYDVALSPEYKFESSEPGVLYKTLPDKYVTNGEIFIENDFMFFNKPKHPFLMDALNKSFIKINKREYGRHPLDVTSPMLLGTLDTRDIFLGESIRMDDGNFSRSYKGKLHYYPKPHKYRADLLKLGNKGTNNYEEMWFNKELYN